jgi:hypothetical protein
MIHDERVEQVLSLIAKIKRGRSSLSAFSGEKQPSPTRVPSPKDCAEAPRLGRPPVPGEQG